MDEENVSKEYLKGYNHADMIYTYMPHALKGMTYKSPDEPSEYTKGFQDRKLKYEKDRDQAKSLSKENFEKDLNKDKKDRDIDKDR